jgi:hypothetical protein
VEIFTERINNWKKPSKYLTMSGQFLKKMRWGRRAKCQEMGDPRRPSFRRS